MSTEADRPFVGTEVTVTATFTSLAGVLEDPTTVTITVQKPDETLVVLTGGGLDNPSVGVWTASFVVDQAGRWVVKAAGTEGGPIVVGQGAFLVSDPIIP